MKATLRFAGQATPDVPISRLPNGVLLAVLTRREMGSAAIAVGICAGSRDEEPGERGAAHFLEHLLMRGTRTASGTEIAERIDGFGGELEPFTTRDWTCVAVQAPAAHARRAAETVLELVAEPELSSEAVEAERGVIIEEVRGLACDPHHAAVEAMFAALFAGHPLGASVIGSAAEVANLDAAAIRGFHHRHYLNARQVAIVVVGAIDDEWLKAVTERWLGDLRAGSEPTARPPLLRPGYVRRRLRTDEAHVAIGVEGLARRDPRLPVMTVVNELLGGGLSSRWVRRLREEWAIAYDVGSVHETFADSGVITLNAGVTPEHVDDAVEEAHRLLDALGRDGITEEESSRARERARGRLHLEMDINYAQAWHALEQLLFTDQLDMPALDPGRTIDRVAGVEYGEATSLVEELAHRIRVTAVIDAASQ